MCWQKHLATTSYRGYKVVIEKSGRFYSPATGVELREGKSLSEVPKGDFSKDVALKNNSFSEDYYSEASGKIPVFVNYTDAIDLNKKLSSKNVRSMHRVVGITISNDLMIDACTQNKVVTGKQIIRIERI